MPAQRAFRQFNRLHGQRGQALLHHRVTAQQTDQLGAGAFDISQRIEQIKHAATFGQQRLTRGMVRADGVQHRGVLRQRHMMQLRITAWQIQAVGLR
ncbi:hypothetical protein D3C81_2124750 [compost metagenome]